MRLFDLHCDTPLMLYDRGQNLRKNNLHIDLEKTAPYESYIQCGAFWTNNRLENETAWEHFHLSYNAFLSQTDTEPDICIVRDAHEIRSAAECGKRAFLLTVEDARILNGQLSRLDTLRQMGVRILTLCWSGVSCIGGSHDTDAPLTDFGRQVVKRCFEIGIIPDVSHASRAVTAEVIAMAKDAEKPLIATHSNAWGVYPHSRNLTDGEFTAIAETGGAVGINIVPTQLCDSRNKHCTLDTVAAHIRHFLELGGENILCLGCDFDGVDTLPKGIENLSSLPRLAQQLQKNGISDTQIEKIFFTNAYGFAMRNLI